MKKLTVLFFISFIFIVPIINIFTEDKKISEVENKILTQFPEVSVNSVLSKRFMNNFDSYTSDQFPFRENFIFAKNSFSYLIGHREFRDIYVSNDRLVEKYILNEETFSTNLSNIAKLSDIMKSHNINTTLTLVPTSIEFYKEDLPSYVIYDDQMDSLVFAAEFLDNSSIDRIYHPYKVLSEHRDKYIYFNTDHHWTQLGAYITYLDMFGYDYTEDNIYINYNQVSNNFLGTYYSKSLLPNINPDSIFSYDNFNNYNINIDFTNNYETLYGNDKLDNKNQYQYFLHGDPAFAIIKGNLNKTSELIIFKDSYAHCFIPFLANEYSKIHIVDPRYYNIDLNEYLKENENITDGLFFHNLQQMNDDVIYKNN